MAGHWRAFVISTSEDLLRQSIIEYLSIGPDDPERSRKLQRRALEVTEREVGRRVYYRGIIEFSNICSCDCLYCGIRASNRNVSLRYELDEDQILSDAMWCAANGYGSLVLQSGERQDHGFIERVARIIERIKRESRSERQPEGLGITLSIGEQSREVYRRLFAAGAHRYLLRIESSNKALFSSIHPPTQSYERRVDALRDLKECGFQLGSGVMIGLPGQSIDMLADDILFFRKMDLDMIGMGPYIVHPDSPMSPEGMMDSESLLMLSLHMIAAARIVLKDVNIAATTALQALVPDGRERGLTYGANVTMPNVTPSSVRSAYQLYAGKPCLEERKEECYGCLAGRMRSIDREVGLYDWGDAPHATRGRKALRR